MELFAGICLLALTAGVLLTIHALKQDLHALRQDHDRLATLARARFRDLDALLGLHGQCPQCGGMHREHLSDEDEPEDDDEEDEPFPFPGDEWKQGRMGRDD